MKDKEKYEKYLRSKRWLRRRALVIERSQGKCEECGRDIGSKGEVHHLTYRHFGNEQINELRYLCKKCHREHHFVKKYLTRIKKYGKR
jgi:5-methylcytosine-specific restriction endonuclease McrA